MKKNVLFLFILSGFLFNASSISAQRDMNAFEHFTVSANAGTLGVGLQVGTPLSSNFGLRAGLSYAKLSHEFDFTVTDSNPTGKGTYDTPLDTKLNLVNGQLFIDYFPFYRSSFHLTGGVMIGTSEILKVSGHLENDEFVEIGDVVIEPFDERVEASLKTNSFKPYLGLGFGRTVPNKKVGFKFELGAMFHGSPKVHVNVGEIVEGNIDEELSDFNDFIKNFSVYPVMNFQLNFRMF